MHESCIFCLIMSIFLIGAGLFCLFCMYKLADMEDIYLKLRRKRMLRKLSSIGFSVGESIEIYEFFTMNCHLTITYKDLKSILQRIKNENKNYKELSHEKTND